MKDIHQNCEIIPALFLHIQKTAGTTIVRLAIEHYGYTNVSSHGDYFGRQPSDFNHLPFISGHFGYNFAKRLMPERFSFTFLRNPIERIISFYFFCRTRNPSELPIYRIASEHDFDGFLRSAFSNVLVKRRIWNNQMWRIASGPGPGDRGIDAVPPDEMLDMAIANIQQLSYIGFFETLEEDVMQILKFLNMKPIQHLHHENATKNRPVAADLPRRTLDLIAEVTEWDHKLYNLLWQERKANVII